QKQNRWIGVEQQSVAAARNDVIERRYEQTRGYRLARDRARCLRHHAEAAQAVDLRVAGRLPHAARVRMRDGQIAARNDSDVAEDLSRFRVSGNREDVRGRAGIMPVAVEPIGLPQKFPTALLDKHAMAKGKGPAQQRARPISSGALDDLDPHLQNSVPSSRSCMVPGREPDLHAVAKPVICPDREVVRFETLLYRNSAKRTEVVDFLAQLDVGESSLDRPARCYPVFDAGPDHIARVVGVSDPDANNLAFATCPNAASD